MANEFYQNPAPVQENAAPQYTAPVPEYAAPQYAAPAPEMPYQQAPVKKSKKGLWITLGAVAAAAIVAVVLIFFVFGGDSGDYTAPVDLEMDMMNAKTYKKAKAVTLKVFASLFGDEAETVYDMAYGYVLDEEKLEASLEKKVEEYEDKYGEDYKFYYEIDEKEKIDKDDLEELQEKLRERGESMIEKSKETDVEEGAEKLGISVEKAEEIFEAAKRFYKKLKSVKVTEGYELEITVYVKGEELDEPEEFKTMEMTVCKVNGKWVDMDRLDNF